MKFLVSNNVVDRLVYADDLNSERKASRVTILPGILAFLVFHSCDVTT